MNNPEKLLSARNQIILNLPQLGSGKSEHEGGCGVTGFISSITVSGKNIFEPSIQMQNRGNSKGGGIAAAGFIPEELGVSEEVLNNDYMLHLALIDTEIKDELESRFITPHFEIDKSEQLQTVDDYHSIGLEVKPPEVVRYFVRIKEDSLNTFINENSLQSLKKMEVEDEFVFQNSFKIDAEYYASLGDKKAFVLSHGKNIMILKVVGYAEQVVKYYKLEDLKAHMWIAHQRYPTRGRVWHPGGCHPFSMLNGALVHNGDFANYIAVSEYLKQRNYYPLFLTDTEEAALLFDLWGRVYNYPLEYLIEAMAPTTEMDFDMLPEEKRKIYKVIQTHHINSSPDGPWFFIIARNDTRNNQLQLVGITDTAMLRPQVFALQEGEVRIGLICSEKQAIDATLRSLSQEDTRFRPIADKYWNARGGSYTDGGAFIFTLSGDGGNKKLTCTDKFGKKIEAPKDKAVIDFSKAIEIEDETVVKEITEKLDGYFTSVLPQTPQRIFDYIKSNIASFDSHTLRFCIESLRKLALNDDYARKAVIDTLTLLLDRRYNTGPFKRSSILELMRDNLEDIFSHVPKITEKQTSSFCSIDFTIRDTIRKPRDYETTLVINAADFKPEGNDCDSKLITVAYNLGWKRFIVYGYKGQRFTGCGLGPETHGVRIDIYGSSGDYLASGIDGMEIYVHGNAQDQLCQIMKAGKVVVYGDVGQTFMYGAKGGVSYVMGNAAGRPLINAVGRPRVVINGTALDYLAESFMAGNPLNGGGFVVLNGIGFDESDGSIKEYNTPYPGSNLFSLASGGAIYVRDPHKKLVDEQLNGGKFSELSNDDWDLIQPYLKDNEELFGITIDRLLTVDGEEKEPGEVYRKIEAKNLAVLTIQKDGLEE